MLIEDPLQLLCHLWLRPTGLVNWGSESKPHGDKYSWEEECGWKMPTFPPLQICLNNKIVIIKQNNNKAKEIIIKQKK